MNKENKTKNANSSPETAKIFGKVEKEFGIVFPETYIEFLLNNNEKEGKIGENYVSFWRCEDILQLNKEYQIHKYLPKEIIAFATDGGGNCFAFDYRNSTTPKIIEIPLGDLDINEIKHIADTFEQFICKPAATHPETIVENEKNTAENSLKIHIGGEIENNVAEKFRIVRNIVKDKLDNVFLKIEDISEISFYIFLLKDFATKPRTRYVKKNKRLEIEVFMPYDEFNNADEQQSVNIMQQALLKSISNYDSKIINEKSVDLIKSEFAKILITSAQPAIASCATAATTCPEQSKIVDNENADFSNFWEEDEDEYNLEDYTGKPLTEAMIKRAEKETGYKLPVSYVKLLKNKNGGIPKNRCFPTSVPTSWAENHIAIEGIRGVTNTDYSLVGECGSKNMIEEWGYPEIGIMICDCPSAGHDAVLLDYRECGKDGEPQVVHVDVSDDEPVITFLAKDFATFIKGLVNEDVFEQSEETDDDGINWDEI